jgi:hypothetical protein
MLFCSAAAVRLAEDFDEEEPVAEDSGEIEGGSDPEIVVDAAGASGGRRRRSTRRAEN